MSTSFSLPTKVISGVGSVNELPKELANWDAKTVLIVTDPGLAATPLPADVKKLLEAEGFTVGVFADVESDPSIRTAQAIADKALSFGTKAFIGLGGGSSIDAAKAGALLATFKGHLRDYAGVGKVPGPTLPLIGIPTTAGTGSEVTVFAVMSDPDRDEKFTISSPYIAPQLAVLDPVCTLKMPPAVTAFTGIDALTHAIEALGSKIAQPVTDALAIAAARLIFGSLSKAAQDGTSLKDREAMCQAAFLAGAAFNSAYLGLSHAIASPLGGHFHMAHGLANAVVLPSVMEFNVPVALDKYAAMSVGAGLSPPGAHPREAAQRLIDATKTLLRDVGLPTRLRDAGAKEDVLPAVARDSLKSVQLKFNPRPASEQQILALLQAAY